MCFPSPLLTAPSNYCVTSAGVMLHLQYHPLSQLRLFNTSFFKNLRVGIHLCSLFPKNSKARSTCGYTVCGNTKTRCCELISVDDKRLRGDLRTVSLPRINPRLRGPRSSRYAAVCLGQESKDFSPDDRTSDARHTQMQYSVLLKDETHSRVL